MVSKHTDVWSLCPKQGLVYAAMLQILVTCLPTSVYAAATVCTDAAPATIDVGDCTVAAGTIPTTVNFVTGATGALLLNGESPTGAVTNTTDGQGNVGVIATTTSAASFGVAGTGDLSLLTNTAGITFNLGHNAAFTTITNEGTFNQTAGTITVNTLNQKESYNQSGGIINANTVILDPGKSFTQSGTGVLNTGTGMFLQAGSSATLANQGTGVIGAANDGDGALIFAGNYNTDVDLASFSLKLGSITVNDGVTLTLDKVVFTNTFNAGQGTSGIVNQTSGALVSTAVNINDGATYNLSGDGVIPVATSMTIGTGAALNINKAANTDTGANISGNGAITVTGGGALTLTGAATHTGGTTITASGLVIGNGGTTGSISGNITNNGTLIFRRSNDLTYSGDISGSGNLQKESAGKLTLNGTSTYTGGTSISAGTLSISADANLGNAANSLSINGSTLETTATLATARSTSLFGSNVFNVTTGTTTHNGNIGSSGGFNKQGAGTLILAGTNNYSGGTTVSAGTLTLQGGAAISNSGAVTVNGGTLDIDAAETIGSLAGSGGIVNLDAALNTGGNNASTAYSGVIQGGNSLTKQGSGTLTLSGANTYSGGTTVSGGTISISADNNLGNAAGTVTLDGGTLLVPVSYATSRDFTVTASGGTIQQGAGINISALNGDFTLNGDLDSVSSQSQQFNGGMTGTGGVNASGSATAFDGTGLKDYSGDTTTSALFIASAANALSANSAFIISGGSLNMTAGDQTVASLAGNGTVSLGTSELTHGSNDTTTTYSGVISGAGGSMVKEGTGTFTLTGDNTYTGSTTISAGTLQVGNGGTAGSLSGNITNNSALIFNRSDAVTFANDISGTGTFTQAGAGSVNLTGTNTYSGTTTINAGTLSVNGSIANSTTTVNAGGTLGGSGTVGTVNVAGGNFAPGNSIGTINVTGNVDFTGGGVYQVEVDAAGNSDLINATGTATLTSGSVQVLPEAGTYNLDTDYTILTAAGGLVGTFNSVTSNLAFLTPTLSYDATNVFLNLKRNDVSFSDVAGTPNQLAVSTLITLLNNTNPTEFQALLTTLFGLTAEGAQQAFDSLSGVQHTHSNVLMLGANRQFLQLLFDRLGYNPTSSLVFNPSDGPLLAYNGGNWASLAGMATAGSQLPVSQQRGFWLQGLGGFGDIDATTNASGADYDTKGFAFGVDTDWRNFIVGLAGSYTYSDADTFGGNTEVDSYQLAAYGGWKHDDYYASANVGFGYHDAEASRAVTVGATTSTATSDYNATTVSASVEVGKDIPLQLATTLTPYAGIAFNHLDRDSFIEAGAGTANLSVTDNEEDSLRTRFGLRLSHAITNADGSQLTPYAYGGYVREHLDDTSTLTAGFSAVPTSTFTVSGVERDRNRAEVGAGLTGKLNDNTTFNIGYDGDIAGSDDHHSFSATVKMVW